MPLAAVPAQFEYSGVPTEMSAFELDANVWSWRILNRLKFSSGGERETQLLSRRRSRSA